MADSYTVHLPVFQGPLELLLELIEKRKLLINDVSLSAVADDFVRYVEAQQDLPMGQTADFIYVASALLLIKSKSLLPTLSLTNEEQGSIDDLQVRLKLLQRFRALMPALRSIFGATPIFAPQERERAPVFSPHERISPAGALLSVREAMKNVPQQSFAPTVTVKKVISLEEMIVRLADRVKSALSMSFKSFAGAHAKERVEVIVSFLAMLELVKRGAISVNQNKRFDDITIETHSLSVPSYA